MNFLSHFYHEYPVNNGYYACGLILPDILSNYSKRSGQTVKLHPSRILSGDDEDIVQLAKGVSCHFIVDVFFHGSEFFKKNVSIADELIKSKHFDCFQKKLYAFCHVFLEIMLDRILLLRDKTICDTFYNVLDTVSVGKLAAFIQLNAPAANAKKAAEHFINFRQFKFIYNYADDERLCEVLDMINRSLQNRPLNVQDKTQLISVIHDFDNTLLSQKFPTFHSDL